LCHRREGSKRARAAPGTCGCYAQVERPHLPAIPAVTMVRLSAACRTALSCRGGVTSRCGVAIFGWPGLLFEGAHCGQVGPPGARQLVLIEPAVVSSEGWVGPTLSSPSRPGLLSGCLFILGRCGGGGSGYHLRSRRRRVHRGRGGGARTPPITPPRFSETRSPSKVPDRLEGLRETNRASSAVALADVTNDGPPLLNPARQSTPRRRRLLRLTLEPGCRPRRSRSHVSGWPAVRVLVTTKLRRRRQ
jgi:hypothetical protein